eukprot:gene7725-10498_t
MSVPVSVGNRRISLDDVAKVASSNFVVEVDPNVVYFTPTKTDAAKNHQQTSVSKGGNNKFISIPIVRSALFCRIVSLLQGKSPVRKEVIHYFVSLLNAQITPAIDELNISEEGIQLISILSGSSLCYNPQGLLVESNKAFELASLPPLLLTVDEINAITRYRFVPIGLACLIGSGLINLSKILDPIAALSCEATCAKSYPFEAIHFDVNRQQRGQMSSASNIRLLLFGSKRINSVTELDDTAMEPFHSAPQIIGPCQEGITIATKMLEIELNSNESGEISAANGFTYNPTQSIIATRILLSSIVSLTKSSASKVATLTKTTPMQTTNEDVIAPENVTACYSYLNNLINLVAQEVTAAIETFRLLEETANISQLEITSNDKALEESDETNNANKPGKKAPVIDDSNLTPEQKQKAEEKRKQKAEKAKEKAAKKAEKKSGANVVVLGNGTSLIRGFIVNYLTQANANSNSSVFDLIYQLINPFDSSKGFINYCVYDVIEKLNSGGHRKPKIPKGARDFGPDQMRIREQAFSAIRRVFKRHGGVEIDTPVFELKEILTGKYGEDSKLIYDLSDQGGELLSLRYDLTVPFARFLAMNSVGNIKRFHIAKVYRRDQPQLNRGRYREFYQCDFDIAGTYGPMVPDAEVITVATEILSELPVGTFMIKLNHRKILDGIFEICGVPFEKFRPICSAVDKLDKLEWKEVKEEMVKEKGLEESVADHIGQFVLKKGDPMELWEELKSSNLFGDNVGANSAMEDLRILFSYLEAMGSLPYISFDLSLARGLDYYTGVIYEAILTDGTSQVGSIAAGGRYDNLVGMFSTTQTPCVGVSIGIERVFTIMESKAKDLSILQSSTIQVFIAAIGAVPLAERMKIAKLLWQANISAEYSHQVKPKLGPQLTDAIERQIPFMIIIGEDELVKQVYKLKNLRDRTEQEVSIHELIPLLFQLGCNPIGAGIDFSLLDTMKSSSLKVTSEI